MLVGIDIDDVLYQTSKMIKKLVPPLLTDMHISNDTNPDAYWIEDMYGLTAEQFAQIEPKLDWTSVAYIDSSAVQALKKLKHTRPDAELCIVTWRKKEDTLPVIQLIKQYYYLDIPIIHCIPDYSSKAEFCDNNSIGIMLDDHADVISCFTPETKCRGVLVATSEYVTHNKAFTDRYHTVLRDWDDLYNLYASIADA